MTNEFNEQNLLKPGLQGNWIAKRFDIWQLRFVSGNELGRIAEERGLMPLMLEGHIKSPWQLGLLQADLIESSTKLTIEHLDLVDRDKNSYFYPDYRRLQQNFEWKIFEPSFEDIVAEVKVYVRMGFFLIDDKSPNSKYNHCERILKVYLYIFSCDGFSLIESI
jgi:hypothetical protein